MILLFFLFRKQATALDIRTIQSLDYEIQVGPSLRTSEMYRFNAVGQNSSADS